MAAEDFTLIRIRRSTLARLQAEAAKMLADDEAGLKGDRPINPEPINPRCNGISMDALICYLLDRPAAKRRRARQSAARRKAAGQVEPGQAPGQ